MQHFNKPPLMSEEKHSSVSLFDQLIFPEEDNYEKDQSILYYKPENIEPIALIPESKIEEETPYLNYIIELPPQEIIPPPPASPLPQVKI